MRLTFHTDYALRVMIYLGLRPERLATVKEVSRRYDISQNHMMKIVQKLGQHGFIETVRGRNGGFRLGQPPQSLNVGTIVRAMEEDMGLVECFRQDGRDCRIYPACVLREVLADALDAFIAVLDRYTLADIITDNESLSRLVGIDEPVDEEISDSPTR